MTADGGMRPGAGFEGGWLAEGLADDAKLECGVCWRVYDPSVGDRSQSIDPQTPFTLLAETWRCPECGSGKGLFMVVDPGRGPKRGVHAQSMQGRLDALVGAYRDADLAMRCLPIYNDRLSIAALGFRAQDPGYVGALITPWFLNLIALPQAKSDVKRPPGATRALQFPSGTYIFTAVTLEQVGSFEFCSLFSPMLEFEDQESARIAASAALEALYEAPPQPAAPAAPLEPSSRRTLLFGRQRPQGSPSVSEPSA